MTFFVASSSCYPSPSSLPLERLCAPLHDLEPLLVSPYDSCCRDYVVPYQESPPSCCSGYIPLQRLLMQPLFLISLHVDSLQGPEQPEHSHC